MKVKSINFLKVYLITNFCKMKKNKLFLFLIFLNLILSCKDSKKDSIIKNNSIPETKIDTISKEVATVKNKTEEILDKLNKDKIDLIAKLKSSEVNNQNKLYESYKRNREDLVIELNNAEANLLEKYIYFYDEKSQKIVLPDSLKKKNQSFKKANIEFWEIGEGYTELRTKPDFYYNLFKNQLTSDYNDFLEIESKEDLVLYSADAGIIIPFKEVAERVLNWEKFLNKYPSSKLYGQARENYLFYIMDYLFGEDNTPTIDYQSKAIYPENKIEFERFISKNPTSKSVVLVQFLLDNIDKTESTDDLRKILDKESSKYFIKK